MELPKEVKKALDKKAKEMKPQAPPGVRIRDMADEAIIDGAHGKDFLVKGQMPNDSAA